MDQPETALDSVRDRLTDCDREPIHIPGSIQPHGCLLVCSASDWTVLHASLSVADFFGASADSAIGAPVAQLIGEAGLATVTALLASVAAADGAERFFRVGCADWDRHFDISVHAAQGRVSIEFEPSAPDDAAEVGGVNAIGLVKSVTSRLAEAETFQDFCAIAARQLKLVTGFDRVMVYRFAEDGSGEVVGEARRPDMVPFFGQHYPAGDIPQQARRLYVANPIRAIADVDASPSPVLPATDAAGAPVDMTQIGLRSVSPVHLQYLRNMGVGASMSLSILRDGGLWGLFACHHDTPKVVEPETRAACELLAQLFSLQIEARERAEHMHADRERRRTIEALRTEATDIVELSEVLAHVRPRLARIVPADGVAIVLGDDIERRGATPSEPTVRALVERLDAMTLKGVVASDSLVETMPEQAEAAAGDEDAAGMLAIPASGAAGEYVLLFRRELARTVTWAGRADRTDGADVLTPRKSFEAWTELVRGRCRPWTLADREAGEALRMLLLELALRRSDLTMRAEQKARERQELLVAELNHRVKNILALVRSLARGGQVEGATVSDFVDVLLGRLEALGAAHDQAIGSAKAALSLEALLRNELKPYERAGGPSVSIGGVDVMVRRQAVALVSLTMHELTTNAAKYGALSAPGGHIAVTWRRTDDGGLAIEWRELGGPPVAPPQRTGFGASLIDQTWRRELRGSYDIAYEPQGVVARLTLPQDALTETAPEAEAAPAPPEAPRSRRRPESFSALLVEDNAIIALDLDDLLREAGATDVTLASSVSEALAALERGRPDVALLDVNLGSETSLAVAERLAEMAVPVLFSSGLGDDAAIADRFPTATLLRKPFPAGALETALDAALAPQA